jgi:peptide/nickel transport system permease protein
MKILKHILWRVLTGLAVLWGAASLTFVAINMTESNLALAILGGPDAMPAPEALQQVRVEYGLDQPLCVQYIRYLAHLAHGDLGESYRLRIPVSLAIRQQAGATFELAGAAALLAIPVSLGLALLTARRKPWIRSLSAGFERTASTVPGFVIGLSLLLLFSFQLGWLPVAGSDGWRSLILPALTLAIPVIGMMTQVLRHGLEEVLEQPFIVMARARGLSEAGVRLGHALRHALIPLVTMAGFIFGNLLGGAVIAEALFCRRGIGRLMSEATAGKDVPVVLGITILAALVYVVVHVVVDLLNLVIDPRTMAN